MRGWQLRAHDAPTRCPGTRRARRCILGVDRRGASPASSSPPGPEQRRACPGPMSEASSASRCSRRRSRPCSRSSSARRWRWRLRGASNFPGRSLFIAALNLASVLPAIVAVFGIVAVLGRAGWVGQGLRAVRHRSRRLALRAAGHPDRPRLLQRAARRARLPRVARRGARRALAARGAARHAARPRSFAFSTGRC